LLKPFFFSRVEFFCIENYISYGTRKYFSYDDAQCFFHSRFSHHHDNFILYKVPQRLFICFRAIVCCDFII